MAVIDGYEFGVGVEIEIAGVAGRVVSFEDRPNRQHEVGVLVDPTPGRRAEEYANLVPAGSKILTGSDYAILRPLWRVARRQGRVQGADRILVSMGATDPVNATARVVSAITAISSAALVDVVLSSAAPHLADVAARLGTGMTLHIDPQDMPALLQRAKLAIGAPGSTSFERAMLGLPTILIQTADNQSDIASAFGKANAAVVLPLAALDDAENFRAMIVSLLADTGRRGEISAAAASLCDGRGALRLLAVLAGEQTAKDGSMLSLRIAEASDSDWLFNLQRQPETRRFARDPSVPSPQGHAGWYSRLLDDTERTLLIVEGAGKALGFLRLDRRDDQPTFEVSIAIDPANHGRGIGAAALQIARRFAPGATLEATVLPGNLASQALFASAGYKQIGPDHFRSVPN